MDSGRRKARNYPKIALQLEPGQILQTESRGLKDERNRLFEWRLFTPE